MKTIYYMILDESINQSSIIYIIEIGETFFQRKKFQELQILCETHNLYLHAKDEESMLLIYNILEHVHGIHFNELLQGRYISYIFDEINTSIAVSIVKKLLTPSTYLNLSNAKNNNNFKTK